MVIHEQWFIIRLLLIKLDIIIIRNTNLNLIITRYYINISEFSNKIMVWLNANINI